MGYWPDEAEALIHRIQDDRQDLWNDKKADLLAEEFSKICGKEGADSLYIMVYDECGGYDNHSFNAVVDQTIYSFRRGKCNVVVYRSVEWNSGGRDYLNQISKEVDTCRYGVIPFRRFYDNFPAWIMEYRVHNTRFIGMISKERNAIVRSVNSNTDWGPGWWITATCFNPDTLRNTDKQFTLVAGWQ
uniref:Zot domain-containing protein n=1 Tax=Caenorhabditis tropicalis TaxID=1561998 RepID=A0A1I7UWL4_9PELO